MSGKNSQKDWIIEKQNALLEGKDEYILSLKKQLDETTAKLNDKTIENQLTKNAYLEISNSRFWKMSEPIRNAIDKIHGNVDSTDVLTTDSSNNNKVPIFNKNDTVKILTTQKSLFYCELIKKQLENISIHAEILLEEPEEYDDCFYFVVLDEQWKQLPRKYVGVQLKQISITKELNQTYLQQILESIAVLDYSTLNIQYFKSHSSYGNMFYYLPCDFDKGLNAKEEYDVDVKCIVDEVTPRVEEILNTLKENHINYICDSSKNGKITLNLNVYDDSLLETISLCQYLSNGNTLVLSENSIDSYEQSRFDNLVEFVKEDEIIDKIEYWLSHTDELENRIQENNKKINQLKDTFEYYFYRFLLAFDVISFDEFYKLVGDYPTLSANRICLSLPEDVERRKAFDKDNQYGFEVFPGLRHKRGWTGCGLSYKFIMKKAKELGMDSILICEDDVLFPEDFEEKFNNCLTYLNADSNWNIFQGVMADVGDVQIEEVVHQNDMSFVKMNHMISMVFNLYKKDIFDYIIHWDETNDNQLTNTIDRALESSELTVVTTSPFLVGHKEDLKSTIWGFDNTEYKEWIERSSKKLQSLVEEFERNKQ